MNHVDISDMYNQCLTYALRRTGISSLKDCVELNCLSWRENLLPKDILMWYCESASYCTQPMEITEDGRIIFISICEDKHYAVYEGENLVSDLSYCDSKPILRLRRLDKLTMPKCVYRLKSV